MGLIKIIKFEICILRIKRLKSIYDNISHESREIILNKIDEQVKKLIKL